MNFPTHIVSLGDLVENLQKKTERRWDIKD